MPCAQLYLHQLGDMGGGGSGSGSDLASMPPGVLRTLKSKACRGAIMFGARLEGCECEALVEQLQATQLCFCCAHGRPTMAPVVDLAALAAAVTGRQLQEAAAAAVAATATGPAAQQEGGSGGAGQAEERVPGGSGRLTAQGLRALLRPRNRRRPKGGS